MDSLRLLSRSSGLRLSNGNKTQSQPLPSAGGRATVVEENHKITGESRKRKRDEADENVDSTKHQNLDESEVRKFQKQHKIKITDLRSLTESQQHGANRKTVKENARLYPQPLQAFSQLRQLGANRAIMTNLATYAYREPTDVQAATILLLWKSGNEEPDLLTVAPTGSGKTLAFLIPLIQKVVNEHRETEDDRERHVCALVLEPTKELVGQVVNEGRKLAAGTGVRITEMRKGMKLLESASNLKELDDGENDDDDVSDEDGDGQHQKGTLVKADILVATPLSIVNAISRGDSKLASLPHVRTLILDEADYLLDVLFRDQVMSIWSACNAPELRVSLWSATIGASIEELAISHIMDRHPKKSTSSNPLLRTIIGLKDTSLPSIHHKLTYASTEPGKLMGLRQLLHPAPVTANSASSTFALRPPFLIFTQTIPRAIALHNELRFDIPASAGGSSRIAVLHSELSTNQRANTMTEFRQGKVWILITTDLLSRGIDFKGINGVVNYDIPTTVASYVHRAGRTGRAGREGGMCVTFYTRDDIKYLKPIANLISASEGKVDKKDSKSTTATKSSNDGLPEWLLSALPDLSKQDRKDLKQRGVGVRRAVKESDDKDERRKKGKNRIGTSSGYERKIEERNRGMIQGSIRRKKKAEEEEEDDDDSDGSDGENETDGFEGFGD